MARAHRMTTAGASNAHPGMRSEWRPTACKTLSSAATLDLPTTRPVSSVMCTPSCDEEQQEAGGSAVRGVSGKETVGAPRWSGVGAGCLLPKASRKLS
eukprot:7242645-Prymnesium_polylepis.1